MSVCKKITALLCSLGLVAVLSACQEQGPAEKTGEQIDEAIEDTRQKAGEVGEEMEEAVEETGERMQD